MKLAVRIITAAFVAGSAAIGFVPVAAASQSQTLTPTNAAWYQPNPTCSAPSGCVTTGALPALPVAPPVPLPDIPLSPFPAGTMHVGYTGGQEVARTYLAFPYDSIDGTLLGATIDIPLDVTTEDGSAQPETAKVQACLVSGDVTATEGSINQPPNVSCDQHASLKYVATPSPHLTGDLKPLLQGLLTTTGIALLPDATAVTQTDAWRVVFSTAARSDAAKTPPVKLTLDVDPAPVTEDPGLPVDVPVDTPVDSGVAAPPVTDPGLGSVSAPDLGTPPTVDQAPVTQQPVQTATEPQTYTVGYAYPIVWLLPLLFLIVIPAIARQLTRDMTPAVADEEPHQDLTTV